MKATEQCCLLGWLYKVALLILKKKILRYVHLNESSPSVASSGAVGLMNLTNLNWKISENFYFSVLLEGLTLMVLNLLLFFKLCP